jgi:hypothetical protein
MCWWAYLILTDELSLLLPGIGQSTTWICTRSLNWCDITDVLDRITKINRTSSSRVKALSSEQQRTLAKAARPAGVRTCQQLNAAGGPTATTRTIDRQSGSPASSVRTHASAHKPMHESIRTERGTRFWHYYNHSSPSRGGPGSA